MLNSEPPITEHIPPVELLKKHPEIISNPRLENTKLLISIPTYHGEWKNGVLVKNLISVLSQNVQENEAVEVNYIFNMDGDLPAKIDSFTDNDEPIWKEKAPDDSYWSKRQVADEAVEFLRKVVQIQADPTKAIELIEATADPLQKKVFELAALNKNKVAISVVNVLDVNVSDIGYRTDLSGSRTIGMDYAEARLEDDGVMLLFDTDAVPQDNQFAHNIHAVFDRNPATKYMLLRIGYQTSGHSKKLIESSPENTFSGMRSYSTRDFTQTTQLAFRKEVFPRLKEIMDLKYNPHFSSTGPGDDDRDTAMRLIGLYADISDGMMYQLDRSVGSLPVSLVEDRVDGIIDGKVRASSLEGQLLSLNEQIIRIKKLLSENKHNIQGAVDMITDPELKLKLETELAKAKTDFLRKQERNLRFNRLIMKDFLSLVDSDKGIEIGKHDWIEDINIQKKISEMPNGTALLTYLKRNKELIDELTDQDVAVMRYCVDPTSNRPAVMDQLSEFQRTIIEYLGYVDPESKQSIPDELRSSLQPLIAELMAYSHIFSLYQLSQEFYRDTDENERDDIREWDRKKRKEIVNYQALQENRDKSWLGAINKAFLGLSSQEKKVAESTEAIGEKSEEAESKTLTRRIIEALSPKFADFLTYYLKKQ